MDTDLIPYPFNRNSYPGIDNPMFVDDIQALSEGIMSAVAMIGGLKDTDFAIISGFEYVGDTIPYYTPGYIFLNGLFFRCLFNTEQGSYLGIRGNIALQEPFNDGNVRTVYTNYTAVPQPNDPLNGCPQFQSSMDQYRRGNDFLQTQVLRFGDILSNLGDAALKNVGTTAGTVMAGNDPRAPYTAVQLDQRFAQNSQVILKGTVPATYVPTNPGDPVNKAYSDSTSGRRLAFGSTQIGDADTGPGTNHTIAMGKTLANTNYHVDYCVVSQSANPNLDIFFQVTCRNRTTTSFDLFFREAQSGVQNILVTWVIWDLNP